MRKMIVAGLIASTIATSAVAHGPGNWVAPLIIGGVVGAAMANQHRSPYIYVPTPPPVVYYPGTAYPDYTYRPMYKMVDVYIPECNCVRSVPVQIN